MPEPRSDEFVQTMAGIFAGGWTRIGDPRQDPRLLEVLAPVLGFADEDALYDDRFVVERIINALDAVVRSQFIPDPSPHATRLLHNVLRWDGQREGVPVSVPIADILDRGLQSAPQGVGRYSESPGSVFFVAWDPDHPSSRYNPYMPWVTVDLPDSWLGWSGAVGASWNWKDEKLRERPRPGGVVAIWGSVPAQFIVGVNGVPVSAYLDGLAFWDEHIQPRLTA